MMCFLNVIIVDIIARCLSGKSILKPTRLLWDLPERKWTFSISAINTFIKHFINMAHSRSLSDFHVDTNFDDVLYGKDNGLIWEYNIVRV